MQLHFHANLLLLIWQFLCNYIFMQTYQSQYSSFYAITFSCKYIIPNIVILCNYIFMQIYCSEYSSFYASVPFILIV